MIGLEEMRVRERTLSEACLPPAMLAAVVEAMSRKGVELRRDLHMHLERASVVALKGQNRHVVSTVARRVNRDAFDVMRVTGQEHSLPEMALACAYFTLRLVVEGFYSQDPQNMAVLASLLITSEAEADELGGPWGLTSRAKDRAGRMLDRARELGYYPGPGGVSDVAVEGVDSPKGGH